MLPGAITYSILPHTPYGKKLALKAQRMHRDVLLHIPMEAESGNRLGPGALTSQMDEYAVYQSLSRSFDEIPFAIGINNHMGSRLTKIPQSMTWTMGFLKDNNLLFLDSKTSPQSTAFNIALQLGVPVKSRQIFLDNHLNTEYISQQFQQLIDQAQQKKTAIAIAHPHPETMKALKKLIPTLAQYDVELVPLSELYQDDDSSTDLLLTSND